MRGTAQQAAYHGVPVVCTPIVSDQQTNCVHAQYGGWGRVVAMARVTAARVEAAVRAVAEDAEARERVEAVSAVLRAHPRSATQRAADWVEFAASGGQQAASLQRPPALQAAGTWWWWVVGVYVGVLLTPCVAAIAGEWQR